MPIALRPLTALRCSLAVLAMLTVSHRATAELDAKAPVVVVTDMTDAGRKLPPPSPEHPVYYQAVNAGYQDYGRIIAGEREPDNDAFLQVVLHTLKKQGYLPAEGAHRPTIVLGFSWGSLRGDMGAAIDVLGGAKVDVDWESKPQLGLDVRQWLRGVRSEAGDRVMELAQEDLFVMNIAAFDRDALVRGKRVALWQTRMSTPTRGVWAADALPRIVQIGGSLIGVETDKPAITTVREAFGKTGSVEIGDMTVVETNYDLKSVPMLDLTKEADSKDKPAPASRH